MVALLAKRERVYQTVGLFPTHTVVDPKAKGKAKGKAAARRMVAKAVIVLRGSERECAPRDLHAFRLAFAIAQFFGQTL